MAFLQKKTRNSLAVRNRRKLNKIVPDLDLSESMNGFLQKENDSKKKSSQSNYVSNSRSGVYAVENNTELQKINPSLYKQTGEFKEIERHSFNNFSITIKRELGNPPLEPILKANPRMTFSKISQNPDEEDKDVDT